MAIIQNSQTDDISILLVSKQYAHYIESWAQQSAAVNTASESYWASLVEMDRVLNLLDNPDDKWSCFWFWSTMGTNFVGSQQMRVMLLIRSDKRLFVNSWKLLLLVLQDRVPQHYSNVEAQPLVNSKKIVAALRRWPCPTPWNTSCLRRRRMPYKRISS